MSRVNVMERIASWQIDNDILQFKYVVDGKPYLFNVTEETVERVCKTVDSFAANPLCELNESDASYIKSMVREVLDLMKPKVVDTDDSNVLIGKDVHAVAWSILMMACTSVIALATFVFVMWGR